MVYVPRSALIYIHNRIEKSGKRRTEICREPLSGRNSAGTAARALSPRGVDLSGKTAKAPAGGLSEA